MQSGNARQTQWMQILLAELAQAQGEAVPLQPLLSNWPQCSMTAQQLFEGVKLLLESGQVEMDCEDERPSLVLAGSSVIADRRPAHHAKLSPGELSDLMAAVAQARDRQRTAAAVRPPYESGAEKGRTSRPGAVR